MLLVTSNFGDRINHRDIIAAMRGICDLIFLGGWDALGDASPFCEAGPWHLGTPGRWQAEQGAYHCAFLPHRTRYPRNKPCDRKGI